MRGRKVFGVFLILIIILSVTLLGCSSSESSNTMSTGTKANAVPGADSTPEKDTGAAQVNNKGAAEESNKGTAAVKESPSAINPLSALKAPASQPKVFPGYFKNVDYSKPENFLFAGEQTKANEEILSIANTFNNKQDLSTVSEIMTWMKKNLKVGDGEKFARTAAQNVSERRFTGCTDMAITFASLTRAKGIPTVFVQTARIDWIERIVKDPNDKGGIVGHQLVEVMLSDGNWYLIDSTSGKLYFNYERNNFSLPEGFYVFAKSTEVWDTGVKNNRENSNLMKSIFKGFDPKKYVNPKYDNQDLVTGKKGQGRDFNGASLVIGNAAVILGSKGGTEGIVNKFFPGAKVLGGSEGNVKESDLMTAPVLIDLHIKGAKSPAHLTKYFPDINATAENGTVFRYQEDGQLRFLIIGENENALLEKIKNLSPDFFSN